MRVAALYDIHGNLPALEAVLAEPDVVAADIVVVGGDIAEGPMPREVIEALTSLGARVRFVRGNADRELVAAFDGVPDTVEPSSEWTALKRAAAGRITRAQRDFLWGQPLQLTLEVEGRGDVLFCHATPRRDDEIVTEMTPDARLRDVLAGIDACVVVCGHTHVQFDRAVGTKRLVNAGSVGLPYEGFPGAYWALIGATVELRRTDYDVEAAVERIRSAGVDAVEETVVAALLDPPNRDAATAQFERMASAGEPT